MNKIKASLLDLGHFLTQHHGYSTSNLIGQSACTHSIKPIIRFKTWLLASNECRQWVVTHRQESLVAALDQLANDLMERGFRHDDEALYGEYLPVHSTAPIVIFLAWLDNSEDAKQCLGQIPAMI